MLIPAAWLAAFAVLLVRARAQLGAWPMPAQGEFMAGTYVPSTFDPSSFPLHELTLRVGYIPAVLAVGMGVIVLMLSALLRDLRPRMWVALVFAPSAALLGTMIAIDPRGFLSWILY
jgi:hypothetical protein